MLENSGWPYPSVVTNLLDLLSWIWDFLSKHTQQVILKGTKSNVAAITSGVPQDTILGPLLFLIFIKDLPEYVPSNICLFADDALLYRSNQTPDDISILEEDLVNLQVWERKLLMSFNADKCEVLRLSNKRRNIIDSSSDSTKRGTSWRRELDGMGRNQDRWKD